MSCDFLLGPAGALRVVPEPQANMLMPQIKIGSTHQLLSGARRRDTIALKRTWSLSWTHLTEFEHDQIADLYRLPGPLVWSEPTRNLLEENVTSGTDALGTTAGFSPSTGAQLYSSTDVGRSRSLKFVLDPASPPTAPFFFFTSRVPVLAGLPYTAAAEVQEGSNTWGHDVEIQLGWFDSVGAFLSGVTSTLTMAPSFARVSAAGVAPAGAVEAGIGITYLQATAPTYRALYADRFALKQEASLSEWTASRPATSVIFEDFAVSVPILGSYNATATLVEV